MGGAVVAQEQARFRRDPDGALGVAQDLVDLGPGQRVGGIEGLDLVLAQQAEARSGADPEAAVLVGAESPDPGRGQALGEAPQAEAAPVEAVGAALGSHPEETLGILGDGGQARVLKAFRGAVAPEDHAPGGGNACGRGAQREAGDQEEAGEMEEGAHGPVRSHPIG